MILVVFCRPLGKLSYMRIWHDNSGKGYNASWYLKYIVVNDPQTRQKYHFLCNRWFAVEQDDGQVIMHLIHSLKAKPSVNDQLYKTLVSSLLGTVRTWRQRHRIFLSSEQIFMSSEMGCMVTNVTVNTRKSDKKYVGVVKYERILKYHTMTSFVALLWCDVILWRTPTLLCSQKNS